MIYRLTLDLINVNLLFYLQTYRLDYELFINTVKGYLPIDLFSIGSKKYSINIKYHLLHCFWFAFPSVSISFLIDLSRLSYTTHSTI